MAVLVVVVLWHAAHRELTPAA
eukprot:COSAG02_NODE_10371_length_1956_cov_21.397080_4_plen_21_part_01